jgi:hypothetical protein
MTEAPDPPAAEPTADVIAADEATKPKNRLAGSLEWLPLTPAVPAVVGAALPWFAPTGAGQGGGLDISPAYCWQAGRVGFLAPLVLIIAALAIIGPRHGWYAKGQQRTYRHDGVVLAATGLGAGVILGLTWWLLPKSYTFSAGLTWDSLVSLGYRIARNPQPGYFVTIVAAVDAVVCGVVYLVVGRQQAAAESSDEPSPAAGKIDKHDGADSGRNGNSGRDQG